MPQKRELDTLANTSDSKPTAHQYSDILVASGATAYFGDTHIHYHVPGERKPSCVIPFRRDPDFVARSVFDDVRHRAAQPSARVGIVGLGGVGSVFLDKY